MQDPLLLFGRGDQDEGKAGSADVTRVVVLLEDGGQAKGRVCAFVDYFAVVRQGLSHLHSLTCFWLGLPMATVASAYVVVAGVYLPFVSFARVFVVIVPD